MPKQKLAQLFYQELWKIHNDETLSELERFQCFYRRVNDLFVEATKKEKLQFTTQFARIAFACHKYKVARQTQWFIHQFRRQAERVLYKQGKLKDIHYQLALKAFIDAITEVFDTPPPTKIQELLPEKGFYQQSPNKVESYKPHVRVVVLEDDEDNEMLICREEAMDDVVRVRYNEPARNASFQSTIRSIRRAWDSNVTVNLLNVEIDSDGVYHPAAFVLQPDYLVDVSGIAMCFSHSDNNPMWHLLKKFTPFKTSIPLMLGNIANFFLDELMNNPQANFQALFPQVFRLNPLNFTMLTDKEIRQIMKKSQRHFVTLKQMVQHDFKRNDIQPDECFLEPSFYSEKYGIQGRLDIFHKAKTIQQSAVVELKSGKAFMPNIHGISQSHYMQALLYDLLIKSVYDTKQDPRNYILYSVMERDQLKFAPAVKSLQNEALQVRNSIVAIEQALIDMRDKPLADHTILDVLNPARYPRVRGFLKKDLELFFKTFNGLHDLEKAYFQSFVSFIAQEHLLAKTGAAGVDKANGLASLWLSPYVEKDENFEILSYLSLKEGGNKAGEEEANLTYLKTDKTNDLANFRKGDIAILYQSNHPDAGETVLNKQIFKCTVTKITKEEIHVLLRYKQFNSSTFEAPNEYWCLEHDLLDSGFNAMYRSLFAFLQIDPRKKQLLLTTAPPRKGEVEEINLPDDLTNEQKKILRKAIFAKDYFLLWGPPGTGKTSRMLKTLVSYLLNETNENILLLAYTNRAVDEICEAIESIGDFIREMYIRVGNAFSTSPKFHKQLFKHKIKKINRRRELRDVIDGHRIFVATVASMSNRQSLLELKQFDRVIIDEASQILEPMLIELLPKFKQFILIGDHLQLPAVVVQDKVRSAVTYEELKEIGLNNLRDSLFERLFLRCRENKWDWAYDMLSHQGRMHQDIMDFPNKEFYKGTLKLLPQNIDIHGWQRKPLVYKILRGFNNLDCMLAKHRLCYIPTATENSQTGKTNVYEARAVAEIADSYVRILEGNGREIDPATTIGIITPYRAQIAQIREELRKYGKGYEEFTVDTVERYQGGAREVIILSVCLNRVQQLDALVSLSTDGTVDRKLNVALTRARHHLAIVGNRELLTLNKIYRGLVTSAIELKV